MDYKISEKGIETTYTMGEFKEKFDSAVKSILKERAEQTKKIDNREDQESSIMADLFMTLNFAMLGSKLFKKEEE